MQHVVGLYNVLLYGYFSTEMQSWEKFSCVAFLCKAGQTEKEAEASRAGTPKTMLFSQKLWKWWPGPMQSYSGRRGSASAQVRLRLPLPVKLLPWETLKKLVLRHKDTFRIFCCCTDPDRRQDQLKRPLVRRMRKAFATKWYADGSSASSFEFFLPVWKWEDRDVT